MMIKSLCCHFLRGEQEQFLFLSPLPILYTLLLY
jgi:hypothetical protein